MEVPLKMRHCAHSEGSEMLPEAAGAPQTNTQPQTAMVGWLDSSWVWSQETGTFLSATGLQGGAETQQVKGEHSRQGAKQEQRPGHQKALGSVCQESTDQWDTRLKNDWALMCLLLPSVRFKWEDAFEEFWKKVWITGLFQHGICFIYLLTIISLTLCQTLF